MGKLRNFIKTSTIRALIGRYLVVLLIILFLFMLFSYYNIQFMRNEYDKFYQKNTSLISTQFSNTLSDLESLVAPFLVDDELIRLSVVKEDKSELWNYHKLSQKMSLYFDSKLIDTNVSIILPKKVQIISSKNGVNQLSPEKFSDIMSDLSKNKDIRWMIKETVGIGDSFCLSHVAGYYHPNQSRPIIITEISEKEIEKHLARLSKDSDNFIASFFMDGSGKIFKLDNRNILDHEIYNSIKELSNLNKVDEPVTDKVSIHNYRTIFNKIDDQNAVIGVIYDEKSIVNPIVRIIVLLTAVLILSITVILSYAMISYRKVYLPTYALINTMEKIGEGKLDPPPQFKNNIEFKTMANHLSKVIERYENAVHEKYIAEQQLNSAKLKFLKSQINPHFLYNCLFSLYNMIKSEDLDNAADLAIYLGKYYQISSHFEDKEISIEQELKHVEMYIRIHQLSSPNKIRFKKTYDETLADFTIPFLSIQTIVENCFRHAFTLKQEENLISISILRKNGDIEINITDNGIGIEEEELFKLEQELSEIDVSESTHGLQNIVYRFKSMYGDNFSYEINSGKYDGTEFVIKIHDEHYSSRARSNARKEKGF